MTHSCALANGLAVVDVCHTILAAHWIEVGVAKGAGCDLYAIRQAIPCEGGEGLEPWACAIAGTCLLLDQHYRARPAVCNDMAFTFCLASAVKSDGVRAAGYVRSPATAWAFRYDRHAPLQFRDGHVN